MNPGANSLIERVQSLERAESLLRAVLEGTSPVTGTDFFRGLVKTLAIGLNVRFAFVAECLPQLRAQSLAYWRDNDFANDFTYQLEGTPCMEVAQGRVCHIPDRLTEAFPRDVGMLKLGTVSYLGVPLLNSQKRTIGHLVIFDDKPMPADALALSVMETFAARAGAELERKQSEQKVLELERELAARRVAELSNQLSASEERYRDLFDEAPIAYVHEALDSRFIKCNRAAMQILGIKPEEVQGTYGRDFIPKTPEAQKRLRDAFAAMQDGTNTNGLTLELCRKDGKPLWIQWWSKPDSSGKYTRTCFIDITARVLIEREKARLEAQNSYLQEEIRSEHNFEEIVGNSPALLAALRAVDQVAPTDSTVLITGETGTGKELIARAIHDRSSRKRNALVKVNCGAISAGLVESELFGHVKGAFTGAVANRDGRFKVANGGTIFLDEVGELPLETQVKLLRVLQEQEFEPIGSSRTEKVDVRIIAATNRDVAGAIAEGKFRSDLFYRLNVFPIQIPSLRERAEDIPLLAMFFLQRFAKKFGRNMRQISADGIARLKSYAWPGNIRELQNVIERAVVLSNGPILNLAPDFQPNIAPQTVPIARAASSAASLEDVERTHIETTLKNANWMIEGERGAAKLLDMHPSTLRSRMQKLGIRRPG
jgi:formate hydrogenlyase transcriptional activator